MNRKRTRIVSFLLTFLLLTGCSQEDLQEDESVLPSDSIVQEIPNRTILPDLFSLPYAPGLTLDPVTCADGMQQVVSSLICEGLFRLAPNFEPIPWLCKSYVYDANSGGKTQEPFYVWGGTGYPYLQVVETSGEENYSQYKSEAKFTKKEFIEKIKKEHKDFEIDFSKKDCIQIKERDKSDRVMTVKLGNLS